MDATALRILVLATVVTTAGCVGGLGAIGPGAEGDGGDTSDAGAGESGDGAAMDGGLAENRTALLLAAGSYTSVWELESRTDGEVEGLMAYTTAVEYGAEWSTFGMVQQSGDTVGTDYESYHADGVTATRYGSGEDATYQVSERPFEPENALFPVESYVSNRDLADFSRVGTEASDGVTVTRYERTERPAWLTGQTFDEEFTWTQFDYVVLVDGDGLVRYESWGGQGVDDEGVTQSVAFRYSITGIGSTAVEEPAWVRTARDSSTASDGAGQ